MCSSHEMLPDGSELVFITCTHLLFKVTDDLDEVSLDIGEESYNAL